MDREEAIRALLQNGPQVNELLGPADSEARRLLAWSSAGMVCRSDAIEAAEAAYRQAFSDLAPHLTYLLGKVDSSR